MAVDLLDLGSDLAVVAGVGERVDDARGAVHLGRRQLEHGLDHGLRGLADVARQARHRAPRRRVLGEEALGQAQGAERGAAHAQELLRRARHELHAAAADVDDQGRCVAERQRAADGEIVEAALFLGRDDARRDAGEPARLAHEAAAVRGLAHRGGGGAQDTVDLVAAGQAHEARQRIERLGHGLGAQAPAAERAAAHLRHLALAIHHLEALAGGARDHHVDGVGADVDGGEPHADASRGHALRCTTRAMP